MGKHWTKEERVYFFRHVLPESKCSTGKYSEQGLCFAALAIQMQEDLDALKQSCRTYTEDVLFQHWYQKVWVGTTVIETALFTHQAIQGSPPLRVGVTRLHRYRQDLLPRYYWRRELNWRRNCISPG